MTGVLLLKRLNWIKWLSIAVVGVVMVSMWLMLKASKAEQVALHARLENAKQANTTSQLTIATLRTDQAQMNQLFVSRAQAEQQTKRQLDEQMETFKKKMANIQCHIPDDVTDSLREPY